MIYSLIKKMLTYIQTGYNNPNVKENARSETNDLFVLNEHKDNVMYSGE